MNDVEKFTPEEEDAIVVDSDGLGAKALRIITQLKAEVDVMYQILDEQAAAQVEVETELSNLRADLGKKLKIKYKERAIAAEAEVERLRAQYESAANELDASHDDYRALQSAFTAANKLLGRVNGLRWFHGDPVQAEIVSHLAAHPFPKLPTFEQVWSRKEAEGYQYGEDALEQVRFGFELARGTR